MMQSKKSKPFGEQALVSWNWCHQLRAMHWAHPRLFTYLIVVFFANHVYKRSARIRNFPFALFHASSRRRGVLQQEQLLHALLLLRFAARNGLKTIKDWASKMQTHFEDVGVLHEHVNVSAEQHPGSGHLSDANETLSFRK